MDFSVIFQKCKKSPDQSKEWSECPRQIKFKWILRSSTTANSSWKGNWLEWISRKPKFKRKSKVNAGSFCTVTTRKHSWLMPTKRKRKKDAVNLILMLLIKTTTKIACLVKCKWDLRRLKVARKTKGKSILVQLRTSTSRALLLALRLAEDRVNSTLMRSRSLSHQAAWEMLQCKTRLSKHPTKLEMRIRLMRTTTNPSSEDPFPAEPLIKLNYKSPMSPAIC